MAETDYSKDALIAFLREGAMSGLINPARARSRINAVEQLSSGMTTEEASDVRDLDLDGLCQRMHKMQGSSIRPEVLEIYRTRVASALEDFVRGGDTLAREADDRTGRRQQARQPLDPGEALAEEALKLNPPEKPKAIMPVPIRDDRIVYLQNIPLDLSGPEAEKICRVVQALVTTGPTDE